MNITDTAAAVLAVTAVILPFVRFLRRRGKKQDGCRGCPFCSEGCGYSPRREKASSRRDCRRAQEERHTGKR